MNLVKIKIGFTYFLCRIGLISHQSRIDENSLSSYDIGQHDVRLNVSSSNNMLVIKNRNRSTFFRFCDNHCTKEHLLENIIKKFCNLTNLCTDKDLDLLFESEKDKKKFLSAGSINDFDSNVYSYFKNRNYFRLGISEIKAISLGENIVDAFIHFAWSEIAGWKLNARGGQTQFFHYNRCKCQEAIYNLLGVDRLICHSSLIKLNGVHSYLGSIMESANGINPIDLVDSSIIKNAYPELYCDLTNLYILDVLCYERDHRPGNYNIILDEKTGYAKSIQAFDNDSTFSFFPTSSIQKGFVGCSPIFPHDKYRGKCIDKDFAEKILRTDVKQLKSIASPYLNKLQLYFLAKRFLKIQKSIKNAIEEGTTVLKNRHDWKKADANEKMYYDCLLNWNESKKNEVTIQQRNFPQIKVNV